MNPTTEILWRRLDTEVEVNRFTQRRSLNSDGPRLLGLPSSKLPGRE